MFLCEFVSEELHTFHSELRGAFRADIDDEDAVTFFDSPLCWLVEKFALSADEQLCIPCELVHSVGANIETVLSE